MPVNWKSCWGKDNRAALFVSAVSENNKGCREPYLLATAVLCSNLVTLCKSLGENLFGALLQGYTDSAWARRNRTTIHLHWSQG